MCCLQFNGFFGGNIWSPLVAKIYSIFVSGVMGTTDLLCDSAALDVSLFALEPDRCEEEDYVWYFCFVFYSFYYLKINCNDPN